MGASSIQQISSLANIQTDPLRNFKFHVVIHDGTSILKSNNPRAPQTGFMSVSGLSVTTDVVVYRQGGMNTTTQKMPGQAQPLNALVLTPTGYKRMGDIAVGDAVVDPRGEASEVIGVYPQGALPVYEIVMDDGRRTRACVRHRWEVSTGTDDATVCSTLDIEQMLKENTPVLLPALAPHVARLHGLAGNARRVASVTYVGDEEVQCIAVSAASHLYITDDGIPTHNSDFSPVTLSRGLICGDANLFNWVQQVFEVMQGTGTNDGSQDFRRIIDIFIVDHPVTGPVAKYKAGWRIYNAWITSCAWGDLDAGANGVELQQITLAHEGFSFKIADTYGPSQGVSFD
ncbi:phage tail protein [Kitasatospora purpeofusca]|uniref:phage tail protein n=1 Tax=Kitasatospora purpeofusca TaxID=67352 RepID=UPI003680D8ED